LYRETVATGGQEIKRKIQAFQKFRECEKDMVFVARLMKNMHLKRVMSVNPVLSLTETNKLFEHIKKHFQDYVEEERPASTYNSLLTNTFKDLYDQTWDYRWQYVVMSAINELIGNGSGREQQKNADKWIAYLKKAIQVYDRFVATLPHTLAVPPATGPTISHEFDEYTAHIAFIAGVMKNIYSKDVNVVNTPFDLFGLRKTNLLYNMIKHYNQLWILHDDGWKRAVMKAISHDSESRPLRYRIQTWNDWFKYLNTTYAYKNHVQDEFQKFRLYAREVEFVAECMQGMSDNYQFHKPYEEWELRIEEVKQLIYTLYNKTSHEFYDNLLKERNRKDQEFDNYTLSETWRYALMRTINIWSVVNHVENQDEIIHWISIIQKAYQLAHPDAILTPPAKAAGPGSAGAKQGPTAPAKVAEPVVEAPPAVDESPIQENEEFQKFKPCKKEMIFVADVMKKIHEKKVDVENLALFGKAKTNVLYDLITRLYSDEVAENLPQTSILYTHSLDYRWQFVVMKAINYQVGLRGASWEEWITYLKESYEYANRTSREFSTFIPYKENVVFVADFMKRMSVTKPKDDDPVLKLALTQKLFDRIQKKYKKLLENGVNTDTLEYTWQYALIETMNELGRMFPEDKLFKKPSLLNYLDEVHKLSHPSTTLASGGGNAAANADIPKLALPSVSPPPSEASEDDVKSDAEESDADGAGQDIGTAPGTPADTNFTPESTPPPNRKAENDRPKSAPQQRKVKETKSAEEARTDRLRGAVTARSNKNGKNYDSLRDISKQEDKDGPPAGSGQQTPTSTPGTPRSGAAGGGAGGRFRESTSRPKPYDKIETEEGNKGPAAQVEVPKLKIPEQEVTHRKEEEVSTETKPETPRASKPLIKKETRQTETLKFKPSKLISKSTKNEEEINVWRQRALEKIKNEIILGKRSGKGNTDAPDKSRKRLPEEDMRTLLYEDKNKKQWIPYRKKITTLARYMSLLINDQRHHFEAGKVQEILNTNLLTAKLHGLLELSLLDDEKPYDELMKKFNLSNQLTEEYIIIHAMNDDVDAWEEWKTFLEKIEPDVDDTNKLLEMRLGSELHTFPVDSSPLIYNLTRRLEALQDW